MSLQKKDSACPSVAGNLFFLDSGAFTTVVWHPPLQHSRHWTCAAHWCHDCRHWSQQLPWQPADWCDPLPHPSQSRCAAFLPGRGHAAAAVFPWWCQWWVGRVPPDEPDIDKSKNSTSKPDPNAAISLEHPSYVTRKWHIIIPDPNAAIFLEQSTPILCYK